MTEPKTASRTATRRAYAPSPGVVGRDMGGAAVLIHLDSNRIFELNPTGARLWALLVDGYDREQMAARMRAEFSGAPIDDLDDTIEELLTALEREGLIRAV